MLTRKRCWKTRGAKSLEHLLFLSVEMLYNPTSLPKRNFQSSASLSTNHNADLYFYNSSHACQISMLVFNWSSMTSMKCFQWQSSTLSAVVVCQVAICHASLGILLPCALLKARTSVEMSHKCTTVRRKEYRCPRLK